MRSIAFFALMIFSSIGASAHPQCEVWFSPSNKLGYIDSDLIDKARSRIKLAAYSLTDRSFVETLQRAVARGVEVRIVLEGNFPCDTQRDALSPNARVKPPKTPLMHLKAYSIDGAIYRSGSANFSPGGLSKQNNDLIVCHDPEIVQKFDQEFEAMWIKFSPAQCKQKPTQ